MEVKDVSCSSDKKHAAPKANPVLNTDMLPASSDPNIGGAAGSPGTPGARVVLVRRNEFYTPTFTGFADFSNHQFGPWNEKRDAWSLEAIRQGADAVRAGAQIAWNLLVLGPGSDGETSQQGLQQGYLNLKKHIHRDYDFWELFREEDVGACKIWRAPPAGKTVWVMREAAGRAGDENSSPEIVYCYRGAEMRRFSEAEEAGLFECRVPARFARRIWVFADEEFLASL